MSQKAIYKLARYAHLIRMCKSAKSYTWVNFGPDEDQEEALAQVPGYRWATPDEIKEVTAKDIAELSSKQKSRQNSMLTDHLLHGGLGSVAGGVLSASIGALAGVKSPIAIGALGAVGAGAGGIGLPLYRRWAKDKSSGDSSAIANLMKEHLSPGHSGRRLAVLE